MHDWRADVRARVSRARLNPADEAEVIEEVAQHLEDQFAEMAALIGPDSARERLLTELAGAGFDEALRRRQRVTPPSRASVWSSTSIARDVRYALRSLLRTPGTLASGVAALALGIGLTTVMFSIIYGLLIKGLPFVEPERIAMIYRIDPTGRGQEDLVPFGDFVRYNADQRSFAAFGGYALTAASVSGGDRPERVQAARLAGTAFDVTGVAPVIGRTLTPADNAPAAPPTAVLSYSLWRDRFAGDSNVLNMQLRVNGKPHAIVGVMPDGFDFPGSQKLWLPLQLDPVTTQPGKGIGLVVVGRLKPAVTYQRANAELFGLSRRLESQYADTGAARTAAQPFIRGRMPSRVYSLLYSMLGAVFLVLLVACANVANLLLERVVNRTREVGIRIALGASRVAVIRQSLVESGVLALLAAVAGAALAQGGIVAFNRVMVRIGEVPFWMDVRLHVPVLIFVLAVALLASLVAGVLPALHSARLDINSILKDEAHVASSRRVGRLSRVIVVGEIALSSIMLLGAGFMTKSILQLRSFSPRFTAANVFTARVSPSTIDPIAQHRFLETLEQRLTAIPAMAGVYLGNDLPGTGWRGDRVALEGHSYTRPQDRPLTRWLAVNPGFFQTFGVRVLRGREILPSDRAGAQRVAVVSDVFVRRYFAAVDPIGKRIRIGDEKNEWLTIVGVVPSIYAMGLVSAGGNHFPPEVLTAFWQQRDWPTASIAMRGTPSVANATTLRQIVASLDSEVPVFAAAAMDDVLTQPMWPARVFGTMFIVFGIVSLTLAAIGLYAVMAFSITRRVRELGIRLALGATSGAVIRMVCWQGARQILVGMFIGLILGAGLVQTMRALLFEVQPGDPMVFALVATVLATSAFMACITPAIRATRVDPVIALRSS